MRRLGWIAAGAAGAAACLGALAWTEPQNRQRDVHYRDLELFSQVLDRVEHDYVSEVDQQAAVEAALQGMLASLDPHSSYMNARDFAELRVQMSGQYGGLGLEVTSEEGAIRVVTPIDDTPASRAGVQAGDFIIAVDGQSILGLNVSDAVDRMRGEAGTNVTITLSRPSQDPFDRTLTREMIHVQSVRGRVDNGDVGVIRISTFDENTTDLLLQAIRDIQRQAGRGLKGVVIDLRNNPGGALDQAVTVSGAFLTGGEVVSTRARRRNDDEHYNDEDRREELAGVPIAVLINGASASAAEIVAGALQDRHRALIIGMTSFGKGSVQSIIPLPGGRGDALRLTTSLYYTPAGRTIQGAGIEPDMEIAARRVDPATVRAGLSEADLPNAFANSNGVTRRAAHVPADQPPEGWDETQDYQLSRALALVRDGTVAARMRAQVAQAQASR